MTGGDVIISGVALVGGAVATYVGLRIFPLEKELADRKEARKQEAEALEKRLEGLHADAERSKEKFESRLAQLEQSYISRLELSQTIKEVGERMDRGVARVESGMKDMGAKLDHLAERVTRVEAS